MEIEIKFIAGGAFRQAEGHLFLGGGQGWHVGRDGTFLTYYAVPEEPPYRLVLVQISEIVLIVNRNFVGGNLGRSRLEPEALVLIFTS